MTHGQQGVIIIDRPHPHHHRIDQRTQAVQVGAGLQPVDIVRSAALGGDAAVQALPQLSDHQGLHAGHERQEKVQQINRFGAQRVLTTPGSAKLDLEQKISGMEPCERIKGPIVGMGLQNAVPAPICRKISARHCAPPLIRFASPSPHGAERALTTT
ncbi:hypothetical protein MASR2M16_21880 [Thauera terpenica]